MSDDHTQPYIPFSQRNGFAPMPSQLVLGEVSDDLRRWLMYCVDMEVNRHVLSPQFKNYFDREWVRLPKDIHVIFFKRDSDTFDDSVSGSKNFFLSYMKNFINKSDIGPLFDLVEYMVRHELCSDEFRKDIAQAFVAERSAYRWVDNLIVPVGNAEQAEAFERALADTNNNNAKAARSHLTKAATALRHGAWADSVRESIHAVESVAVRLAPEHKTLGKALNELERRGHLKGGLKAAFSTLYGYTNDEEGIRHALVFEGAAKVDETDALFMLGACASFVSYLLARSTEGVAADISLPQGK